MSLARSFLTAALLLAATLPAFSQSEHRVALVIGNAAYAQGALRNPVNDARAVADHLHRLGFVVIKREDLKARELGPVLREFRSRLTPGSVALFFYAGHGVQVKGVNYLPTVDADIESEDDVSNQELDVSKVLALIAEAKTVVNIAFPAPCPTLPTPRPSPYTPRT